MTLPPKPDFRTPDAATRAALFGRFDYRPIGGGNIKILGSWAAENIVKVTIPQIAGIEGCNQTGTIYFHKKGVAQLQGFFEEVERQGLKHLLLSWGGSFVPRFIRGSNTSLSNHAWGTAFDINAAWNGLNRTPAAIGQKGTVIPLVKIANDFGFYWGGHYNNRLDGMHFELATLGRFPKSFVAFSSADPVPRAAAAHVETATAGPSPEPVSVEQHSTAGTVEQPPQVIAESERVIEGASAANGGIVESFDKYGQKVQDATATAEKFGVSRDTINQSVWSILQSFGLKIGGGVTLWFAHLSENPVPWVIAGLSMIGMGVFAWKWSRERKRNADKKS